MYKGIVIEMNEHSILVMTPDGQFKQISNQGRSCQLGEEISFIETMKKPFINWRSARTISAASVFCLMIVAVLSLIIDGGANNKVAAYVTMDINPSIEVGIDKTEHVLEVRGINEDGDELLKGLIFDGVTIDAFSELVVQRIEQGHYLDSGDANIIISSTVIHKAQKQYEIELAERIKLKFVAEINKTHTAPNEQIVVTAITAPKEVREEAIAQGVSTGKKAVQLLTRNKQQSTSDEELKEKPIQQMIKENGGISEILPKEHKVTKDELKSILKEIQVEREERKKENKSTEENKGNGDKENNIDNDREKDNNRKSDNNKKNDKDSKNDNVSHDEQDKPKVKGDEIEKIKLNRQQEKEHRLEQQKEEQRLKQEKRKEEQRVQKEKRQEEKEEAEAKKEREREELKREKEVRKRQKENTDQDKKRDNDNKNEDSEGVNPNERDGHNSRNDRNSPNKKDNRADSDDRADKDNRVDSDEQNVRNGHEDRNARAILNIGDKQNIRDILNINGDRNGKANKDEKDERDDLNFSGFRNK